MEELTPDKLKYIKTEYSHERTIAKSAGFAINYGGNGSTIAKNCNIPTKDGEFVYESYFNAFPGLRQYFDYVMARTLKDHYITFNNVTGRKLFISPNDPIFKYKDDFAINPTSAAVIA